MCGGWRKADCWLFLTEIPKCVSRCVLRFVQCFDPQGRSFRHFHVYYYVVSTVSLLKRFANMTEGADSEKLWCDFTI